MEWAKASQRLVSRVWRAISYDICPRISTRLWDTVSWPLFRLIVNKDSISHFLAMDKLREHETINSFSFAWVPGSMVESHRGERSGAANAFMDHRGIILEIIYRGNCEPKIIYQKYIVINKSYIIVDIIRFEKRVSTLRKIKTDSILTVFWILYRRNWLLRCFVVVLHRTKSANVNVTRIGIKLIVQYQNICTEKLKDFLQSCSKINDCYESVITQVFTRTTIHAEKHWLLLVRRPMI